MKPAEVAAMTYREMWEIYVEPILKAQAELRQQSNSEGTMTGPVIPESSPTTVETKIAEAQAIGCFMFGANPLEVAKAIRKSHGQNADIDELRDKLLARQKASEKA